MSCTATLPQGETTITIVPPKNLVMVPHYLLVNGQLLGIVKKQKVTLRLPPYGGQWDVTVRSLYRFIEGSAHIEVAPCKNVTVTWTDHERWWNMLFTLDLLLWAASLAVTIPQPWDTLFTAASNGFFALWLLRLWITRKRYFKLIVRPQDTRLHKGIP